MACARLLAALVPVELTAARTRLIAGCEPSAGLSMREDGTFVRPEPDVETATGAIAEAVALAVSDVRDALFDDGDVAGFNGVVDDRVVAGDAAFCAVTCCGVRRGGSTFAGREFKFFENDLIGTGAGIDKPARGFGAAGRVAAGLIAGKFRGRAARGFVGRDGRENAAAGPGSLWRTRAA